MDAVPVPVGDQHAAGGRVERYPVHARELRGAEIGRRAGGVVQVAPAPVQLEHAGVVVPVRGVQAQARAAAHVHELHALPAVRRYRRGRAVGRDVDVVGPEPESGQSAAEHAAKLAGKAVVRRLVWYGKRHSVQRSHALGRVAPHVDLPPVVELGKGVVRAAEERGYDRVGAGRRVVEAGRRRRRQVRRRIEYGMRLVVGQIPHGGRDRSLDLFAYGPPRVLKGVRAYDRRARRPVPQRSRLDVGLAAARAVRENGRVVDQVRHQLGPALAPGALLVVLAGVVVDGAAVLEAGVVHGVHVVANLVQHNVHVRRVVVGCDRLAVEPYHGLARQVRGPVGRLVGKKAGASLVVPLDRKAGRLLPVLLKERHAVGHCAYDARRAGHAGAGAGQVEVAGVPRPLVVELGAGGVRVVRVQQVAGLVVVVVHERYRAAVSPGMDHEEHVGGRRVVGVVAGNAGDLVPPGGVGVGAGRLALGRVEPSAREPPAYHGQVVRAHLDAVHRHAAVSRVVGGNYSSGGGERLPCGPVGPRRGAAKRGGRKEVLEGPVPLFQRGRGPGIERALARADGPRLGQRAVEIVLAHGHVVQVRHGQVPGGGHIDRHNVAVEPARIHRDKPLGDELHRGPYRVGLSGLGRGVLGAVVVRLERAWGGRPYVRCYVRDAVQVRVLGSGDVEPDGWVAAAAGGAGGPRPRVGGARQGRPGAAHVRDIERQFRGLAASGCGVAGQD